ncbi:MAG: prenyltransferase [Methanomicrobiales archaeon]
MYRDKIIKILRLGRFHFLTAGFLTFTAGSLLAGILTGQFYLDKYLFGYLVLLPAHLSVSYSNDYFDWEADHLLKPNLFTGGSGILVENPDLLKTSRNIAISLILISLIMATVFSLIYSSPFFLILAVFGNLLGWFYSAPPLKLSYRGMGEIAMTISGFIIPALGFLAIAGFIDLRFVLFSIPQMIYQVVFILSVELPDRKGDKIAGKNTFVVKFGADKSLFLILFASALGTISLFLLGLTGIYNDINFNLVTLFSLIPLTMGIYGYNKKFKDEIVEFTKYMVSSLILLILLIDIYFLVIL